MAIDRPLAILLRHERALTLAAVAALVVLAWAHLWRLQRDMLQMAEMGMAPSGPWASSDALLAAVMWAVMMAAMMLPSAVPMLLVFVAVNAKRREAGGPPYVNTGAFVLGYLAVWSAFSVGAAAAQWRLHEAALMSPETLRVVPIAGAALFVSAGVYQLTPLKYACLVRCRTPLDFLMTEWRAGTPGALVMGLRHGAYCLGCCWALMALLFAGGVMNLLWVAAISGFVLLEKAVSSGRAVSWASGALLIAWGFWSLRGGV